MEFAVADKEQEKTYEKYINNVVVKRRNLNYLNWETNEYTMEKRRQELGERADSEQGAKQFGNSYQEAQLPN